jgi:hypothetical protein
MLPLAINTRYWGGFLTAKKRSQAIIRSMKYVMKDFSDKVRSLVGDGTYDIPEEFIINALNWAYNELPRVPKLEKLFRSHERATLDAKGHFEWNLNGNFRRLLDIPMMEFWTTTGGKPCKLNVCNRDNEEFFRKNGIIELKEAGVPCEYTIEQQDDDIKLVFDRPLDVPVIVDYIAYGIPKPVTSKDDVIELSAIAENLVINVIRSVYFHESDDFAFATDITSYLDNKQIVEAIQQLNKRWGNEEPIIVGER